MDLEYKPAAQLVHTTYIVVLSREFGQSPGKNVYSRCIKQSTTYELDLTSAQPRILGLAVGEFINRLTEITHIHEPFMEVHNYQRRKSIHSFPSIDLIVLMLSVSGLIEAKSCWWSVYPFLGLVRSQFKIRTTTKSYLIPNQL